LTIDSIKEKEMSEQFDVIVIGAGPGGEVATDRLRRNGKRVALVERELIGGECAYWACIPTKTLLRPPTVVADAQRVAGVTTPQIVIDQVIDYRNYMIRNLNDKKQVESYEKQGVTIVRGEGRLTAPGRVEAGGRTLEAESIVVATGTLPRIPPIEGLQEAGYWTNRDASGFSQVPASVIVLGGSAQSVEFTQMFRRFGAEVTVVERGPHLLGREETEIGEHLAAALKADGVTIRLEQEAVRVTREANNTRVVTLKDGSQVRGEQVIVAMGRLPRTEGLGLEAAGARVSEHGVKIDEYCRAAPGLWAIGDVTGVAQFTHVAKYQGRIAADDILGRSHPAHYDAVPRVVFTDPEIAATGLTLEKARAKGIDALTASIDMAQTLARPSTYGKDVEGKLGLIADRRRRILVGAWAFGPEAGEWIHQAVQAIHTETPISVLRDVIPQFPTFSEAFLYALEALDL
jgi:pyruvate/2-oxoglutarate dehydrogenase complex dihydrolipoamide dehydrogenase (E3) component